MRANKGRYDWPEPGRSSKSGSKIHVLFDRVGLPLAVGISAANTNDAEALRPLVQAIPAVRSRRGPRRRRPTKLHADKAYDHTKLRRMVIERTMCAAKAACRIPGSAGRDLEGGSWVEWLT
ncbi:transposase [Nocardia sp. CA-107356]|uniref:transposase n=1 Tax=Nocardia sp. CA-107356 TaxID=3239972 RepID=UPI003D8A7BFB